MSDNEAGEKLMANVKTVKIEANLNVLGVMDATGRVATQEDAFMESQLVTYQNVPKEKVKKAIAAAQIIRDLMAQTVVPYFGLNINFTGNEIVATNQVGGKEAYLQCFITGKEAVSYPYLDALVDSLKQWGDVIINDVTDVE